MNRHFLSGVYAAALTPLKNDLSIDLNPVEAFLDFLGARGCHGALLLGTTGEGPAFAPEERIAFFKEAKRVHQSYPHFKLLAGTGTPSLQETIDLTRAAFENGFDGVVTLPPYFFRKVSDDGLFRWFDEVIRQAVPDGKYLLGYHIPGISGVGLSHDLLARLKDAHPQKFAGIKDSSGDPDHAIQLGERFKSDLLVLTGNDALFQHALEHHAQGGITAMANLYSQILREAYDIYWNGSDCSEVQARLDQRRTILDQYAPYPPILKAMIARKHGFDRWLVRPPLIDTPIAIEEKAAREFSALDDHE
jgi:4-hydroxy-tetrahydrodipicolinate synthase